MRFLLLLLLSHIYTQIIKNNNDTGNKFLYFPRAKIILFSAEHEQSLFFCTNCTNIFPLKNAYIFASFTGADPGFCVRGTKVGEGSGDRLRSPAGAKPPAGSSWVLSI